jgi:hypothetical protein
MNNAARNIGFMERLEHTRPLGVFDSYLEAVSMAIARTVLTPLTAGTVYSFKVGTFLVATCGFVAVSKTGQWVVIKSPINQTELGIDYCDISFTFSKDLEGYVNLLDDGEEGKLGNFIIDVLLAGLSIRQMVEAFNPTWWLGNVTINDMKHNLNWLIEMSTPGLDVIEEQLLKAAQGI